MNHGIRTSRGPNLDHRILDANGNQIGRAWTFPKKSQGIGVQLPDVYWRSGDQQVPNRRGGSPTVSVPRLKDVPDFIAKTLAQLVEIDAKAAADRSDLIDKTTVVTTATAKGAVLDWLVAQACSLSVELTRISCSYEGPNLTVKDAVYAVYLDRERYEPSVDPAKSFSILESEIDLMGTNQDGTFFAVRQSYRKTPETQCRGSTLLIAAMRTFVTAVLGKTYPVPICLLTK